MPALAQPVAPTIGTGNVGSAVSNTGSYTVTGGTQRLNTLFHSFQDFSPEANNVLFQLDGGQSAVEHVIGRVTGNNLSLINGISFGPNASLSLPGSFFTSTAESITFKENHSFSSRNPSAAPLLTVSAH